MPVRVARSVLTSVVCAGAVAAAVALPSQARAAGGICGGDAVANPPTVFVGPVASGQPRPILFSGHGGCYSSAGGTVEVCLDRSSWSGWRTVTCLNTSFGSYTDGYINGRGTVPHGTYTYRTRVNVFPTAFNPAGGASVTAYASARLTDNG